MNNKTNIQRKLNSQNYINLTIKDKGKINILNILDEFPENIPSEILLFEKPINFTLENGYDFRYKNKNYGSLYVCVNMEENNQTIIIKWNKTISNMMYMFFEAKSILTIDFTNFDSSSVVNMHNLFHNCYSLISLKLNNFDTSSITDINGLFYCCYSLISLDLNLFNTSSVTDMSYMFSKCSSLLSLDLTHFNTSVVTDMSYMFSMNGKVIIDNYDLDFENFYYFYDYFYVNEYNFSILTSLNLNNFNTYSVENMEGMFSFLGIESLDLSKFNTHSVINMGFMFFFLYFFKIIGNHKF